MLGRRIATFTGTALVTGALGFAAVATSGNASALHSPNDAFLAEIGRAGITFESTATSISNARYVCTTLADGESPMSVSTDILAITDLTAHQAAVFVAAAMENYCPR